MFDLFKALNIFLNQAFYKLQKKKIWLGFISFPSSGTRVESMKYDGEGERINELYINKGLGEPSSESQSNIEFSAF